MMDTGPELEQIAEQIASIYERSPGNAEESIEGFLSMALGSLPERQKIDAVERLAREFKNSGAGSSTTAEIEDEVLSRVFSLLLGRKVSHADLSSEQLLQRMADSMNTVFDSLNQIVEVINQHLYREYPGDQTIRRVIGSQMTGDGQGKSLESYLGQIKTSFLTAQQAFRKSARITVNKIVNELDPARLGDDVGGGFKFGPLKKAEYFEVYEAKYDKVRKWFESDRFMEDFLREFEKACEKMLT